MWVFAFLCDDVYVGCYLTYIFKSDLNLPLRKWRDYIFKNYKGSGDEIRNLKILNSNEYKRQQLKKHQLFTADVDAGLIN